MPYNQKHKLILEALVNSLGHENVSDDPALTHAYTRDYTWGWTGFMPQPDFVVLPGNSDDIQQIVRLANKHKFPFSIIGSMQAAAKSLACKPYWCIIDPKRMNRVVIDEKNMFAIIEPYATHAQVQAEAMKRGLFNGIPTVGGQASCLANHVFIGGHPTGYKTGFASRNVLGMKWVLPNGEIMKTGSLAIPGAGHFWGTGPGMDPLGLLKAFLGHFGSLGIIAELAIKLFPWPGPSVIPTEGVAPEKISEFPVDMMRWFLFTYPTFDQVVEAMREIGKAEIGFLLQHWPDHYFNMWASKSNKQYWDEHVNEYWKKNAKNMVVVGLASFTSKKQLDYEEKILKEIVEETGGKNVPDELYDRYMLISGTDFIRETHSGRGVRHAGSFLTGALTYDSLDSMAHAFEAAYELIDKRTPPILDSDHADWINTYDLCHFAGAEIDLPIEKSEELSPVMRRFASDSIKMEIKEQRPGFYTAMAALHKTGRAFADTHRIAAGLKKALDPNDVANPTRFIDVKAMEREEDK